MSGVGYVVSNTILALWWTFRYLIMWNTASRWTYHGSASFEVNIENSVMMLTPPQLHHPSKYIDLSLVTIQKKWSHLSWRIHLWHIIRLKLINNPLCKIRTPKMLMQIVLWIWDSLLHILWCTSSTWLNSVFQIQPSWVWIPGTDLDPQFTLTSFWRSDQVHEEVYLQHDELPGNNQRKEGSIHNT